VRKVTAVQKGSEESICVGCGLCCDGTLHATVTVTPDDETAVIEAKLEIVDDVKGRVFRQPCPHFSAGSCSIYGIRPGVCRSYRCALLINVEQGNLSASVAREKISTAKNLLETVKSFAPDAATPTKRAATAKRLQDELRETEGPERERVGTVLHDSVALERFLKRWFLEEERTPIPFRGEAVDFGGKAVAFVGDPGPELAEVFGDSGRRISADGGFVVGFDGFGKPRIAPEADRQFNTPDKAAGERPRAPLAGLYVLDHRAESSVRAIGGIEAADAIFTNTGSKGIGQQIHWLSSLRLVRSTPVFRASGGFAGLRDHAKQLCR